MSEPRHPPFFPQLVTGVVYIALIAAAADALALLGWFPPILFLAVLLGPIALGIPAMAVGEALARSRSAANRIGIGIPALLGGLAACIGGTIVLRTSADLRGGHAEAISVAETAEQEQATTFTFRDAWVLVDRVGEARVERWGEDHNGRRRRITNTRRVAPLVPDDWQPGQPVPVWLTDGGARDPAAQVWLEPRGGGLRARDRDGGYAQAIQDACVKHGLTSAPGAPLLEWRRDPREGLWGRIRLGIVIQGGFLVVWVLGYAALGVARRLRPPAAPGEGGASSA